MLVLLVYWALPGGCCLVRVLSESDHVASLSCRVASLDLTLMRPAVEASDGLLARLWFSIVFTQTFSALIGQDMLRLNGRIFLPQGEFGRLLRLSSGVILLRKPVLKQQVEVVGLLHVV